MQKETFKRIKNSIEMEMTNLTENLVQKGYDKQTVQDLVYEFKENMLWAIENEVDDNESIEGKDPVVIKDNGWNNGYNCVCPNCNHPLDTSESNPNFCSYCGQKLKWNKK